MGLLMGCPRPIFCLCAVLGFKKLLTVTARRSRLSHRSKMVFYWGLEFELSIFRLDCKTRDVPISVLYGEHFRTSAFLRYQHNGVTESASQSFVGRGAAPLHDILSLCWSMCVVRHPLDQLQICELRKSGAASRLLPYYAACTICLCPLRPAAFAT